MSNGIGNTVRIRRSSVRSLLRAIGRVALWVVIALLLLRGVGAVVSAPDVRPSRGADSSQTKSEVDSFAVRFVRTYLTDPSPQRLAPFLAEGAHLGRASGRRQGGVEVAQAEATGDRDLGGGREVVTVACELRDARTLYLAVPIVRSRVGEVAALGAPSIVAVPAAAGVDPERPQPPAGPEGPAIEALVAKFLPAYLASPEPSDLSYLLAPGAVILPLGGSLELLDAPSTSQLGAGEGSRRSVIVSALVRDPVTGASYPLAYRLELVKHGRWYVEAVQGALL